MYNKLFEKILDSSIWLESSPTRIVWITFLAMMDQDGFVALSSDGNVANRARVSEKEAIKAIAALESPDQYNPDQEQEGRRIERIPGTGWLVLNASKYRDIIKAETARAQNRERVRKHRAKESDQGQIRIRSESDLKRLIERVASENPKIDVRFVEIGILYTYLQRNGSEEIIRSTKYFVPEIKKVAKDAKTMGDKGLAALLDTRRKQFFTQQGWTT